MNAESISSGRFVAPKIKILPEDVRPSHNVMNSAFKVAVISWSTELLSLRNESISSMNMIQGCSFVASENRASTSLLDSPYHLSMIVDILMEMKLALDLAAKALASMVFPHPGGPYKRTPFGACRSEAYWSNSSGQVNGRITDSCKSLIMSSKPPTSSKETPISSGGTTLFRMTFSYSDNVRLSPGLDLLSFSSDSLAFFLFSLSVLAGPSSPMMWVSR
ncbi:hypothetical protein OGAPHI_003313 [Ogataea philodendri]|uniref:Uncharacterized protein n=1 Tax=Ogataea philodendri TaxID=1378263 RepID=A0A9P8P8F6_9ASCO|nr:uncharacterized protein OGAPHI_003313 [Ogataea philodendri]KAH3666864.1 hypothetical protein OGAPHI_003313 [Ogataea philodendri]